MAALGGAAAMAEPLDKLSSSIDAVLINIGRTFRDNNRPESKAAPPKARPPRSDAIATSASEFHTALDQVEIELRRAAEVLTRDLTRQREAREERDRISNSAANATLTSTNPADAVPTPVSMNAAPPETLSMTELMSGGGNSGGTAVKRSPNSNANGIKANGIVGGSSAVPSAAAHTMAVTNPPTSQATTSTIGNGPNATTAASQDDFDFDSMFGSGPTNTDTAFDLDFSTGDMGGDMSGLGGDLFGENSAMNLEGGDAFASMSNGQNSGGGDDVNNLITGLDSLIDVDGSGAGVTNTGDDFNMVDMTGSGNLGGTTGDSNATNQTSGDQQKSDDGGQGRSTDTQANGLGITTGGAGGNDTTMGGTDDDMEDIFGNMLNELDTGNSDFGNFDDGNMDDWLNA